MRRDLRIETMAVHSGKEVAPPAGAVVFPIHQSAVYTLPPGAPYHDIPYGRLSNTPSQLHLHERLRGLEGAEAAVATASGMAAVTTTLLALMRQGDHLLVGDSLYGGTHHFLTQRAPDLGWAYTFVDAHDPDSWAAAATPKTKVFLVESITNPLVKVPRLREVVDFCRKAKLVSIVDNTFASPVNFRPLDLGFDIVFHSATKYLNGHSDLIAGCVMGRTEHLELIRRALNSYGGSLDPH
ncbi:MAG TPA: aminotransferase class I/II-fold pyridoxal phosphate-dependent enzyme, partial [Polyangiaceae bacterium]|nr:aminotransferase class I/II-fold pyridoxal phosphate-dependent enzyme [Polyangiaceae bacterium]